MSWPKHIVCIFYHVFVQILSPYLLPFKVFLILPGPHQRKLPALSSLGSPMWMLSLTWTPTFLIFDLYSELLFLLPLIDTPSEYLCHSSKCKSTLFTSITHTHPSIHVSFSCFNLSGVTGSQKTECATRNVCHSGQISKGSYSTANQSNYFFVSHYHLQKCLHTHSSHTQSAAPVYLCHSCAQKPQ